MKLKNKTISNPPDYNNSNLNPSDVEDKNNTGKNFYCGESEFTKRTHIDLDTLEDKVIAYYLENRKKKFLEVAVKETKREWYNGKSPKLASP